MSFQTDPHEPRCASIFSLTSFMLNFHGTRQGVPLTGLPSTTRKTFHLMKQTLVSLATRIFICLHRGHDSLMIQRHFLHYLKQKLESFATSESLQLRRMMLYVESTFTCIVQLL